MLLFSTEDRHVGRVDRVPGLFHVATRFICFNFVPFFPRSYSCVVVENGMNGEQPGESWCVHIGRSWRSVFYFWLRVAAPCLAVAATVQFGSCTSHHFRPVFENERTEWWSIPVSAAAAAALWFAAFRVIRVPRAGHARALELAELTGMRKDLVELIYHAHAGSGVQPPHPIQDADDLKLPPDVQ